MTGREMNKNDKRVVGGAATQEVPMTVTEAITILYEKPMTTSHFLAFERLLGYISTLEKEYKKHKTECAKELSNLEDEQRQELDQRDKEIDGLKKEIEGLNEIYYSLDRLIVVHNHLYEKSFIDVDGYQDMFEITRNIIETVEEYEHGE